jgi:phosphate transport system protein
MTRHFDQSLNEVKNLLLDMGRNVEIAIAQAVKSLEQLDETIAQKVIDEDKVINQQEQTIDDVVTKLIATQQPVAIDLRKLIAAMKIASDLERMADYAVNIAKVTIEFKQNNLSLFKKLEDIPKMAQLTQKMVNDGINSYIDGNIELAKSLAKIDDQVDELYDKLFAELVNYVRNNPEHMQAAMKLSFVARYLERIADHTTNISESIIFIETGKREDLNK